MDDLPNDMDQEELPEPTWIDHVAERLRKTFAPDIDPANKPYILFRYAMIAVAVYYVGRGVIGLLS